MGKAYIGNTGKRLLFALVFLAALVLFAPVARAVPEPTNYLDENGASQTENAEPLTGSEALLNAGWYVAKGTWVYSNTLEINGVVHLILADGCSVSVQGDTSKAGIQVGNTATLYIYAQSAGTGTLTATGGQFGAGIGGGSQGDGGTIIINGGIVAATGHFSGAGIGGGLNGNGGTIKITSGTVIATSIDGGINKYAGAGIGSGWHEAAGGSSGTITIEGGNITATGGNRGAGIGGGNNGNCDTIIIKGNAAVTANGGTGAAGIGGGNKGAGGNITISTTGTVDATGNNGGAGIGGGTGGAGGNITITAGTVSATGGDNGAGIGGGNTAAGGTINITGGDITANGAVGGAGIGGGSSGGSGGSITISNAGTIVKATGDSGGGAGIGGGYAGDGGTIKITSGTVTADGSEGAAGIGGGRDGSGNSIEITGGTVKATSGAVYNTRRGAGIGGGAKDTGGGNAGVITISGGNITAITDNGSAAIGTGAGGSSGSVSVSAGTLRLTTDGTTASIWARNGVTVTGGTIEGTTAIMDQATNGSGALVYKHEISLGGANQAVTTAHFTTNPNPETVDGVGQANKYGLKDVTTNGSGMVTFYLPAISSMTVSPNTFTSQTIGAMENLSVIAIAPPTAMWPTTIEWESSNTSVATVNAGVVTITGWGNATITAKARYTPDIPYGNGTCTVNANATGLNPPGITGPVGNIAYGGTAALTLTTQPTGGSPAHYTYQWQQSTDGNTWTNIAGATTGAACTSAALTGDTYFRLALTDTSTSTTVYSNTAHVQVDALPPGNNTITVIASPAAGGSPTTSAANAASGATITLTANPNTGYRFDGWNVTAGGVTLSSLTNPTAIFTMPNIPVAITANYTYTGSTTGGTDTGDGYSPTFTTGTLTDNTTGVVVSGNNIDPFARLRVTQGWLHDEGSCPACDEIRAQQAAGNVLALYDISLTGYHTGAYDIFIPFTGNTGQSYTTLHCLKGTLEQRTAPYNNGGTTTTWAKLSPFAVIKGVNVTVPENVVVDPPKTGDATGHGVMGIGLVVCALIGMGMVRRRKGSEKG